MIDESVAQTWDRELDELFLIIEHRFRRVEACRRMRDYVRGLLASDPNPQVAADGASGDVVSGS